jgi:hypothetical protein
VAYLTNSIGAHSFVSLKGAIPYRQEVVETWIRPGVAGHGLRRLGAHGQEFTLTSKQYFADFAAAKAAMQLYDDLSGSNAVTVTRNGVNHGDYFVLEVVEAETYPCLNPTGNATSSHTVCLVAKWKLLS